MDPCGIKAWQLLYISGYPNNGWPTLPLGSFSTEHSSFAADKLSHWLCTTHSQNFGPNSLRNLSKCFCCFKGEKYSSKTQPKSLNS